MDITDKIDTQKFEEKVKEIAEHTGMSEVDVEEKMLHAGPKKLYKMGVLNTEGWRQGSTKKSLEKRKKERRKKKKRK